MSKRILSLVSVMVVAMGVSLFATPSASRADTIVITSIQVTVGEFTWCDTNSSCGGRNIWNLDAPIDSNLTPGITLKAGESLILTQTGPGFNFDTSEGHSASPFACSPGNPCTTALSINTTTLIGPLTGLTDGAGVNILANNNIDDGSPTHNESANWDSATTNKVSGFGSVFFGYADNIHTLACADTPLPGNCFPNSAGPPTVPNTLWQGTATYFIGSGVTGIGSGVTEGDQTTHCSTTVDSTACFDAGAILIYNTQLTAVPEPSTVLLVGTLMIGLMGWHLRRNRKTI
jgi:hypothetical protein